MKLADMPSRLVVVAALTFAATVLWNWSADHLPMWAAWLVLIGILLVFWSVAAYARREERRRERERRQRSTPLW